MTPAAAGPTTLLAPNGDALSAATGAAFAETPPNHHELPATPPTCQWGYFDRDLPASIVAGHGDAVTVEAVSHHASDAPDLTLDPALEALWAAFPPDERGPGVHLITGPIDIVGAEVGSTIAVRIDSMSPRHPYGANCAAHWGLLYDLFGKERITIYSLDRDSGPSGRDRADEFPLYARPEFAFDFVGRPLYDQPGFVSHPHEVDREEVDRRVRVPVRPHFGVLGVAPDEPGRRSTVPPGVFGGNVDNWRFGPGATVYFPVFRPGAGLFVGDPHFAQGDGEICGTAIEASASANLRVALAPELEIRTPILETADAWFTHGFGPTLDAATRMAAEEMIVLVRQLLGVSADEAYSICSVAVDLGVTQVVDQTVGCHAILSREIVTAHRANR